MARINIEDSLFKKRSWTDLCIQLGDRNAALGALFFAWSMAQNYWSPDKNPIPLTVWEEEGLEDAIIDVGLAEKRPDGVYMKGSEEQFAWLIQKHDAGQKGGRPKKETKRGETGRLAGETGRNRAASDANRVEPSYSSSSSNSRIPPLKPPPGGAGTGEEKLGEAEFQEAYSAYPGKSGSGTGRERYHRVIKTRKEHRELLRAIEAYRLDLERPEKRGISPKNFTTFLGTGKGRAPPWRDCLEPDYGKNSLKKAIAKVSSIRDVDYRHEGSIDEEVKQIFDEVSSGRC